MTVMCIFQRFIRCFICRKEGEHRGTWGKDASKGGGGVLVWKPLRVAPLAPMPEAINAGSLPALKLLFEPRGVRFGTPHNQVLLQHWAQPGWVKQWSQGKAVVFEVCWAASWPCPGPSTTRGVSPRTRA